MRLLRRVLDLAAPVLRGRAVRAVVSAWIGATARDEPAAALRRLLELQDAIHARIEVLAVELDGGVHAKHRLIRYHDFFVERVRPGETVLDVGTGKGELAHDLAVRAGAKVTGIDTSPDVLAVARSRRAHPAVEWVEADLYAYEPGRSFDVLVLSNVLEHLRDRPQVLRRLVEATGARRVLIRVPLLERDWTIALRRDLGVFHYSDPTHTTEYDPEQLRAELAEAGLEVDELQLRWGEIWASARPAR